jgi:AcrR family transcriptional regulator
MSPRPKTISDASLVDTALHVLAARGAGRLRLSDVAAASGLAPATLLQRFGSRDALLDAIGNALVGQVSAAFAVRSSSQVRRVVLGLSAIDIVRHLAFLAARPGAGAAYSQELRKQVGYCLAEAVETRELAQCDIADLSRRIQLAYLGLAAAALLETRPLEEAELNLLIDQIIADHL